MTKEPKESWAVLGGGVLGQALALRLRDEGKSVTIIERANDLGGLAAPWCVAGITVDKFYHVILPFDQRLLALIERLGLTDELVWKTTETGFFTNGCLVPLNGSLDYLKLPVIGLVDKLRLATLLVFAARIPDGSDLDKISVKDWLTKWCGPTCYRKLWLPLLKAKLGSNHAKTSAAFIWASIRRLYLARKGAGKTEQLGFVRGGGYDRILKSLRSHLAHRGISVQTGAAVSRVYRSDSGLCVETEGTTQHFDRVVSTLPSGVTAQVVEGLGPEKSVMESVLYQGVICATLVLSRPLGGYYLTYLTDEDFPFTAIVEMSSLTETQSGKTIVYLPRYVAQDDPFFTMSDDDIQELFLEGLRRVYPDLMDEEVIDFRCAKARQVMAVPTVGYRNTVPPVETSVPGLFCVNSAQILDGTLNVDATLGVIEDALPLMLNVEVEAMKRSAA